MFKNIKKALKAILAQKPWLCLRIRDSIPNATAFLRESKRSNYVYNNKKSV